MKWILTGLFVFSIGVGSLLYFRGQSSGGTAPEIDWRNLAELDYTTGISPDQLKKHDNTRVKIPGFMVPLEDDSKNVTEFLLVPSPQACIHVPAPPPNQMVYVKMKTGGGPAAFGPIWVYGVFRIVTQKSQYGDASFELTGDSIEPYN
ncbi:MAG: DUF3299 domain-containing protein [Moraxellaceae bacterium]|nr:DUF3299 domain-containing protein [Pseudobdellovibrionaceae bacterium]